MYLHERILNTGDSEPRAAQLQRLAARKPRRKPRSITIGRAARHQAGPPNRQVPAYLREVYSWAYLTPSFAKVLDRQWVVEAILWGNARRLVAHVVSEIEPGWRVLQPAAVYGTLSRELAAALGPNGSLTVSDVAPLQVGLTRSKLADLPQARAHLCDAAEPARGPYDAVACFFLLHEVPEDMKTRIVQALLGVVRPGGKVVFVDYHRPHPAHPLRLVMQFVFAWLEPFAHTLWTRSIADYAQSPTTQFHWRKETLFGGLYQVVVATRRPA
jgi:ubiquinone/menaquinone biosynthesis C-methylase UbiE